VKQLASEVLSCQDAELSGETQLAQRVIEVTVLGFSIS